jgi:hypothetical protein
MEETFLHAPFMVMKVVAKRYNKSGTAIHAFCAYCGCIGPVDSPVAVLRRSHHFSLHVAQPHLPKRAAHPMAILTPVLRAEKAKFSDSGRSAGSG